MTIAKLAGRGRRAKALVLRGPRAEWCRAEIRGKLVIVWVDGRGNR